MPVYGPWQDVPPGVEHRQTFPAVPGGKGAIEHGTGSATATYTTTFNATSRTAAMKTDGTFVRFTSYEQNVVNDWTYTPRNTAPEGPSGLLRGIVNEYVGEWLPNQGPEDLVGAVKPADALYGEFLPGGMAKIDHEVVWGPWTVPMQPDYAEVYPQAGGQFYNANGDAFATSVPPATFHFEVGVLAAADMNLTQVNPSTRVGQGPAMWDLPTLYSASFSIPERTVAEANSAGRFEPALPSVRIRPTPGQWHTASVWCDWWPSSIGGGYTPRVISTAGFTADVFMIVYEWPPYRWVYPDGYVFPTSARYGWGVVL